MGMVTMRGRVQTEVVPASVALMMGMMETTGLRTRLNEEWRSMDSKLRNLSGGMAAKAVIGNLFDDRTKAPLYNVHNRCLRFPHDILFGAGVGPEQISDTSLASRLDAFACLDMPSVIWESYDILTSHYGLGVGDELSGDGSNYTVYGVKYDDDGTGTLPALGGNAKDHSKRLQKNIYGMTDKRGIVRYAKAYDGNTSDKAMNVDAIRFLSEKVKQTGARFVLTGDCKLCDRQSIREMEDSGIFFVTKVPANFENRLRDRTIFRTADRMEQSEQREGLWLAEWECDIDGAKHRLVAFRLDSREAKSDLVSRKSIDRTVSSLQKLSRRRFDSEEEAREYLSGRIPERFIPVISVDADFRIDDKATPRNKVIWRIVVNDVHVNEDVLKRRSESVATSVLITNLPSEGSDAVDSYGIVRHYLDQYLSEKNFRLMKSGMNVDDVYLHTPGRQDAMFLMIALATQMANVADFLLKVQDSEKVQTIRAACKSLVMSELVYDRSDQSFSFNGSEKQFELFQRIAQTLSIDDRHLMGF